ncbi:unnamed protein product, partial [Polarella glacialis]
APSSPTAPSSALELQVELRGASEPRFNRVYVRQTTSSFLVAAPREGLDPVTRCGAERRGPWVYVAVADPTDGCEGRPYLWLQSLGKGWQWKLAVSGEQKSRYGSWLRRSGEFPRGLGPWQSL